MPINTNRPPSQRSSRAFAATHKVAVLARSQPTLDKTLSTLPSGSEAHGFTADASDPSTIEKAWSDIHKKWPEDVIDVAVFNAPGGKFSPGGFLEKTSDELMGNLKTGV